LPVCLNPGGSGCLTPDLAYGARMLARSPAFTAVAILSLALGIAANTPIFSLIDTLLLRQLPVLNPPEPVAPTNPTESGTSIGTSTGERDNLPRANLRGCATARKSSPECWPKAKGPQQRSRALGEMRTHPARRESGACFGNALTIESALRY